MIINTTHIWSASISACSSGWGLVYWPEGTCANKQSQLKGHASGTAVVHQSAQASLLPWSGLADSSGIADQLTPPLLPITHLSQVYVATEMD